MIPITREELLLYTKEMLFHNDQLVLEKRRKEDETKPDSKDESQTDEDAQTEDTDEGDDRN